MSLRGSYSARIDDRGRLKVPVEFRRQIESDWGGEFFVTSIQGDEARLYPMPVWREFEAKLLRMSPVNPARMRLQKVVNFFGQTQRMDAQGRVLLQEQLRERAALNKEVKVLGYTDHLYVQNAESLDQDLAKPLSPEDLEALDHLWS